MDATPDEIVGRWSSLDGDRSQVKTRVQAVYDYCLPRRATVTTPRPEGSSDRVTLYDSTAETAAERGATSLYGAMCPSGRAWFLVTPPIEYGRMAGEFSHQMLGVSETMRDEMARSNYAEAAYESFLDLVTAGLCTMEPARGEKSLFEFTSYPFEQVVFLEDRRGRVDTVYRRFPWTARQIVQEFGEGVERVGKAVWDAYSGSDSRGRDKTFEIVHAAVPRSEFQAGERDVWNMPVASLWASVADKVLLRRSGWPQLRYLVTRWTKACGEKHGRSPAMSGMPDIKMVNDIEEAIISGAEQVVRPPILNPDGCLIPNSAGKVVFKPGSLLNYRVNAIHPSIKPEPWVSGARVDFGHEYAESKREFVRRVFFNDLFLIVTDTKQRTATEVREIMAEKMNLLGPQFGRMKVELFDPMIRILLSILGEVPGMLAGLPAGIVDFANIRYTSTLALAMEYAELGAMSDAMMFLSPFAEIDPTVWDNFTFDEISREIAEKMALPPRWLKPRDEVKALREARMQYQAQQLQMQMAQQQIENVPKLTGKVDPSSVLAREAA